MSATETALRDELACIREFIRLIDLHDPLASRALHRPALCSWAGCERNADLHEFHWDAIRTNPCWRVHDGFHES